MITKIVSEGTIEECHCVRDEEKFNSIVESMEENGWIGRPLVVVDLGGEYKALTGSHRLAAARKAGIGKIPVACVEFGTMFEDYGYTAYDLKDPDETYRLIEEYDAEAAELFYEDIMTE